MPVTSTAVGFSVASAAQKSQNIVVAPPAPRMPANVMFDSVYPYDGFGAITAAAQIAGPIVNFTVAVTEDASRLPPVLVVSTSTYEEPTVCGGAVRDGDGVDRGVPDKEGVAVGVPERVGVSDGVPDTVRLLDGVPLVDGVEVGERV